MPLIDAEPLTRFAAEIFARAGVEPDVAQTVAESLVLANLKGHDSHGGIRVPDSRDDRSSRAARRAGHAAAVVLMTPGVRS